MDESDPDDLLKHTTFPGGSFLRFGAKDSDAASGRSPTSPLDLSLFANFGGLFSPRSPSPSSPHRQNKWVFHKVGLSFLCDDEGQSHSFTSDNIVLAPQIKTSVVNIAAAAAAPNLGDQVTRVVSDSVVAGSPRRSSSSSPMDIIISSPLSAREMALSEDYTCIISHGPNPKTTHIFGDCILDCDPSELEGIGTNDVTEKPDDDSFSRLCLCAGKSQDCQNIHIHGEEGLAEKEPEKGDAEEISYSEEDLFDMAMPLNT